MIRSTEYSAVSAESVLLSLVVLTVSWTVNGGGTLMVGVGVGAAVTAGVFTVGVAATAAVAIGTAESTVASAVATGTAGSVVVSVANAAAEQSPVRQKGMTVPEEAECGCRYGWHACCVKSTDMHSQLLLV